MRHAGVRERLAAVGALAPGGSLGAGRVALAIPRAVDVPSHTPMIRVVKTVLLKSGA